jgi:hypothetical protein
MSNTTLDKEKGSAIVPATHDVESGSSAQEGSVRSVRETIAAPSFGSGIWAKLSSNGVEMRGAEPVPEEKRSDTRFVNVFTIFATSMTSLLP